jgi:hypothetical protein
MHGQFRFDPSSGDSGRPKKKARPSSARGSCASARGSCASPGEMHNFHEQRSVSEDDYEEELYKDDFFHYDNNIQKQSRGNAGAWQSTSEGSSSSPEQFERSCSPARTSSVRERQNTSRSSTPPPDSHQPIRRSTFGGLQRGLAPRPTSPSNNVMMGTEPHRCAQAYIHTNLSSARTLLSACHCYCQWFSGIIE